AHMGAEVIKVESEARLCATRRVIPFADDQPGVNRAGYFNQYNQGKRSIALNLSIPEGTEIVRELVRRCDVVVDNFSAGAMERMGLGYQTLRHYRRDIIMLSISGCGQSGPWRNVLSYGPTAAALSGFYSVTGYESMGPSEAGVSFADPTAGMMGAIAVMAALFHRRRTGEGQYIDLSQLEATIALLPEALLEYYMNGAAPERAGNHDSWMAPHNCYKSRGDDNQWISIAIGSEAEWRGLCTVMSRPELASDARFETAELRKRNESALDGIVTAWTSERDRWEMTKSLQNAGVAAFPSMSSADLARDAHLRERGFLVELEHPEVGRRVHAGIPWKMSNSFCEVVRPAPLLGADTDDVLKQLLAYPSSRIEELRGAGVLR
ncbi:MAG: CaiB/BaiF CoA transferase family protein, partial [Candidatus Binataceae bacterium]